MLQLAWILSISQIYVFSFTHFSQIPLLHKSWIFCICQKFHVSRFLSEITLFLTVLYNTTANIKLWNRYKSLTLVEQTHIGFGPICEGSEPLPLQSQSRYWGTPERSSQPPAEGKPRPASGADQDPGTHPHLLHEDLHPDPQPAGSRHRRGHR